MPSDTSTCLRASWASYLAYAAVPVVIIVIGVLAAQKVHLNTGELAAFFLVPFTVLVVAVLKLWTTSLCVDREVLRLSRINFRKMTIERVAVSNKDIVRGILTKSYFEKMRVQETSGLKIVPWSLLYIQYRKDSELKQIAFNVSSLDSKSLKQLMHQFSNISITKFGKTPEP